MNEIAIIGMSGRFPGAKNLEEYWVNIRGGVESITIASNGEQEKNGNRTLPPQCKHVKAGGILEEVSLFDASFFNFTPREAKLTDPQQRWFLQCAWEALEHSGYDSERFDGQIGVFTSSSRSRYLQELSFTQKIGVVGDLETELGLVHDFLATRVSYKLNLTGPSLNIHTACSSSLVTVHMAVQSLLFGECDIALAGGVSIRTNLEEGYICHEGGILSPDGHCRPFDASDRGTVPGNGLGVVVLKRLNNALFDGDFVHAIIKGSAINNDGSVKVGYTAPSIEGQVRVISEAMAVADVEPETIAYVETHGTGTHVGDPIEIAALNQVFDGVQKGHRCAIGSVKANIGLQVATLEEAADATLLNTVPSAVAELLRIDGIPRTVMTINLAGEALPRRLVSKIYELGHIRKLFNLYGASESTTYSTYALIDANINTVPPIGLPINNTQIYILDDELQPVPIGVTGEIYIGGMGLARGYFNQPGLTAEQFIPNPLNHIPGSRLYRTGDCGRYQPDGLIEYIGRIDNQVKVRGFRIELGEIETLLLEHSIVEAAIAIARMSHNDIRDIIGYVVLTKNAADAVSLENLTKELHSYLYSRIPSYMMPTSFVVLDALPLTSNGKVDRKALSQIEVPQATSNQAFSAPQNAVEEAIATVWQEVLETKSLSVESNFYDIGGNSLLMVRVLARLHKAFPKQLTLIDLYRYPTIRDLAKYVSTTTTKPIALSSQEREKTRRRRSKSSIEQEQLRRRSARLPNS